MKAFAFSLIILSFVFLSSALPSGALAQGNDGQMATPQPSPQIQNEETTKPSQVSLVISIAIHWVIVPGILVIILLYAFNLPQRVTDQQIKVSGNAGIFAGLIVFVIFVVSQQKQGLVFSSDIPSYNFTLLAIVVTVVAAVCGFVIAWIVDAIKRYRALGFLVLFIVASTTIAMYGYVFIKDVRSVVVFMSLGVMLGALVHIIWFPEAMNKYSLSGTQTKTSTATSSATKHASTRGENRDDAYSDRPNPESNRPNLR
jgi:hypothetical protein